MKSEQFPIGQDPKIAEEQLLERKKLLLNVQEKIKTDLWRLAAPISELRVAGLNDTSMKLATYFLDIGVKTALRNMDDFDMNLSKSLKEEQEKNLTEGSGINNAIDELQQIILHTGKMVSTTFVSENIHGEFFDAFGRFIARLEEAFGNFYTSARQLKHLGNTKEYERLMVLRNEYQGNVSNDGKFEEWCAVNFDTRLKMINDAYEQFKTQISGFNINPEEIIAQVQNEINMEISDIDIRLSSASKS